MQMPRSNLITSRSQEGYGYTETKSPQNNVSSHSLLVGLQNTTAAVEDSLAVPYKIKCTLTI